MVKLVKMAASLALVGLLSACGGTVILKDPEGASVKKVALIGVYAQRGVSKLDGGGSLAGLTAIASLVKSADQKDEDFGGSALSNHAIEAFETEFSKVHGWNVLSSSNVFSSDAYKSFVEKSDSLYFNDIEKKMLKVGYVTGDDMVILPGGGRDQRSKVALASLAKELNVDAVAVVQMDMKYDLSTGIGGMGTAAAKVGLAMVMVDQKGDWVIKTAPVLGEKKAETRYRRPSNDTVPMVGGAIVFNDDSAAIFKDSIRQGLIAMREDVEQDLAYMAGK